MVRIGTGHWLVPEGVSILQPRLKPGLAEEITDSFPVNWQCIVISPLGGDRFVLYQAVIGHHYNSDHAFSIWLWIRSTRPQEAA